MVSIRFLLSLMAVFIACTAHPLKQVNSIADQIIDPSIGEFMSEESFKALIRQQNTDQPSKSEAAGISASNIGFMKGSEVGSAFDIPGIPGFEITATLKGSVRFTGMIGSNIETKINNASSSYSDEFNRNYKKEEQNLRSRARGGFFFFFQAAANYGFSKTKETDNLRSSEDYKGLSKETNTYLNTAGKEVLEAVYDITYKGVSQGRAQRVFAFAFIRINQIQMDSGRILNVVQKKPDAVVANENNEIVDETPDVEIEIRTIDDLVIKTELGDE